MSKHQQRHAAPGLDSLTAAGGTATKHSCRRAWGWLLLLATGLLLNTGPCRPPTPAQRKAAIADLASDRYCWGRGELQATPWAIPTWPQHPHAHHVHTSVVYGCMWAHQALSANHLQAMIAGPSQLQEGQGMCRAGAPHRPQQPYMQRCRVHVHTATLSTGVQFNCPSGTQPRGLPPQATTTTPITMRFWHTMGRQCCLYRRPSHSLQAVPLSC